MNGLNRAHRLRSTWHTNRNSCIGHIEIEFRLNGFLNIRHKLRLDAECLHVVEKTVIVIASDDFSSSFNYLPICALSTMIKSY